MKISALVRISFFLSSVLVSACIAFAQQGQFDGPAELPRVHVQSALADTPSPGKVLTVRAGDDLQAAINSAECGDRIELEAGATFAGNFRFPQKPCDDANWVTIRTSAPDTSLPPESTRLTPCFAGVASLPGRPDFHCAALKNVLAKIEFDRKGGLGPLIFLAGANHYRFIGLEITRAPGPNPVSALAIVNEGGQADHLVFDRVWMHGNAQDETTRALALVSTSYVAVIDSFFSDFHCIAVTGSCTDAQVISDGGGRTPSGQFRIENNFLEASGENILFGGGGASMTPSDIEIRHNYFFKPMIWKPGQPGFVPGYSGRPFIVKNFFELKNAQRVLFEGNILENCWGGFSQNGFAILLTPKNQSGHCPQCKVTDVTIRYDRISNVGAGFAIANVADDDASFSAGGERYSIHDVVLDDVRGSEYQGAGLFAQLISISPPLRNISIVHSMALVPRAAFSLMNLAGRFDGFDIENNVLAAGQRLLVSSGGGARNCAEQVQLDPGAVFKDCFILSTFSHNLLMANDDVPKGNIGAKDLRSAGILENGNEHYSLCAEKGPECKKPSTALRAGSDQKDIGPDFAALERMLSGVN